MNLISSLPLHDGNSRDDWLFMFFIKNSLIIGQKLCHAILILAALSFNIESETDLSYHQFKKHNSRFSLLKATRIILECTATAISSVA